MGYHDVNPLMFITSDAFKDTNTSEDAYKYGKWLENSMKKARAMSQNIAPRVETEFPKNSVSTNISEIQREINNPKE